MRIKEIFLGRFELGSRISIKGWVKSHRQHGEINFININDGSTFKNQQIVYKKQIDPIPLGTSIEAIGTLNKSKGNSQVLEILADEVIILKKSIDFPIQKKEISLEYLRENVQHIRHRTALFTAVSHIKNELFHAIHNFFKSEGFLWFQNPITTENSCEGGADSFVIKDSESYFNKPTLLTVSGQFHAEAVSQGLGLVYTFGPTFRSEKSNTSRHLSEFWMIEPEMAFWNLEQTIDFMEKFIKHVVNVVLENNREELEYLSTKIENNKELINKLENVVNNKFERISYEKAIEILGVEDGTDLSSEQEKFITNKYGKPVFIFNYPRSIKSFYMQPAENNKVKSVDLLIPEIGELIGGSERISDKSILEESAKLLNIPLNDLEWYKELRNFGYHSSSGFGVGFERLICFVTGLKNIKDAINFPRSYRQIKY